MRINKANEMMDYGYDELEKIAPKNSVIELDVKEDPQGHFSSLVKIKANNKFFIVKKEADSMYESFHKAIRALKAQLAKNKINHRVFRKLKFDIV